MRFPKTTQQMTKLLSTEEAVALFSYISRLVETKYADLLEFTSEHTGVVLWYPANNGIPMLYVGVQADLYSGVYYKKAEQALCVIKQLSLCICKSSASFAYKYADYVIHKRWPEAEGVIATDAYYSFLYAELVIHGRFEAGEPTVARSAKCSTMYACKVIKGRFEAGEPAISQKGECSLTYARAALHGPFPAGEYSIMEDKELTKKYIEQVLHVYNADWSVK